MTSRPAEPPVPAYLAPYVEVLGADLAVLFLLTFGGAQLYFPRRPAAGNRLVEIVGYDKAVALANRVGNGLLRVPLGKPFIVAHMYHRQGRSITDIARTLHISENSVRRQLPDRDAGRQLDFFG